MEKHDILASYLQDGFVIVKDVFCKKDVEDCKKDLIEICLAASFCDEEKISVEEALKKVFGGKATVSMFEMTKLVSKHLS